MDRRERPFLTATAWERGLGVFLLGSARSRAAARALVEARKEAEMPQIICGRSILDGSELDRREPLKRAREGNGLRHRIIVDI